MCMFMYILCMCMCSVFFRGFDSVYICAMYVFKILYFQNLYFFVKDAFCGSVGTGLSMCLVCIGVRSCTSESSHTPHKRELFGSCYCCCCCCCCSVVVLVNCNW